MTDSFPNAVNPGGSPRLPSEGVACFASASESFASILPGRTINCSLDAGWKSLLVRTIERSANVETFEAPTTPDQLIVICTRGACEMESFSNRVWKNAAYRPGLGGMTVGGHADRLRWRSKTSEQIEVMQIHLPQYYLDAAAEEYRRAGMAFHMDAPDSLGFCDPVISQMALSFSEAIATGAPNLYAESAAQFLAAHLLSLHSKWSEPSASIRTPGIISDRRLKRVLEFMEHHHTEHLSLAQLAREAGVSRFHFVRLFKVSVGITPHQHLIRLRMNAAASMLDETNLNVQEIALRCGYISVSHFSAAFQKHFSQTPSEYRTRLIGARPVRF